MAELYAQKLDISDDRVKEASISEVTFTQKAYAESAVFLTADAGVRIADKQLDLKEALIAGKITEEQYKKSLAELEEMTAAEYAKREAEALALKEDAGLAADKRAAAEIIEEAAKLKKSEKALNTKYYASKYLDHIVRAVKVSLIKRDSSISKEKEKELDKRLKALKTLNDACINKYSKVKTFADRLLSISDAASAKKLAAPVQQDTNFKYVGK
jgi:uncharacterized surface protein with fasciclin (FAS1) repeats